MFCLRKWYKCSHDSFWVYMFSLLWNLGKIINLLLWSLRYVTNFKFPCYLKKYIHGLGNLKILSLGCSRAENCKYFRVETFNFHSRSFRFSWEIHFFFNFLSIESYYLLHWQIFIFEKVLLECCQSKLDFFSKNS